MAFLGNKAILNSISERKVIEPFDEKRIKNGAYELSLGAQVFQTNTEPRE